MNNEKKVLALSFIAVITLILVVIGATYAFFQNQGGGSDNIDVNANTATTDNLSFQVGDAINIYANESNFGSEDGNITDNTTATAILTANNATNTATSNYYVYLDINTNEFVYTTENKEAELLLKVIDPTGVEVTTLGNLERKTSGGLTGFDITTYSGLITIADNYEITANTSKTDTWQVEVILVNLDSDQVENTGKIFNASLIIRDTSPIGITNVSTSNITSNSITLNVDAESENEIVKYYYAKNEEEYIESDNSTYTFNDLNPNETYNFKVYAVDSKGYKSNDFIITSKTLEAIYFANYIKEEVYTGTDGDNGLYYHDGVGSYTNADQEAGDNSYRYAGANPNNYVCFGSDASPCPNDNLYRIIGVFGDEVKLIKYDYANSNLLGTDGDYSTTYNDQYTESENYKGNMNYSQIAIYYWNNSTNNNTWSESQLNTKNLNQNYLNNIGDKWSDLIEIHTWQVGGISWDVFLESPSKTLYNYELGTNKIDITHNAKIGLLYISDYGYAAIPSNWTIILDSYDNDTYRNNNWMFMGLIEATIVRLSDYSNRVIFLTTYGGFEPDGARGNNSVRPTFYLKPEVTYVSGDGSQNSPYRIECTTCTAD